VFYPFFVFLLTPTGYTRRPITTVYGSKRVFPRKVGSFGGFDDKTNDVWGSKLPKNMIYDVLMITGLLKSPVRLHSNAARIGADEKLLSQRKYSFDPPASRDC